MVVGLIFELTGTVSPASAWQINEIVLPIGPEGIKVAGGINKAFPIDENVCSESSE